MDLWPIYFPPTKGRSIPKKICHTPSDRNPNRYLSALITSPIDERVSIGCQNGVFLYFRNSCVIRNEVGWDMDCPRGDRLMVRGLRASPRGTASSASGRHVAGRGRAREIAGDARLLSPSHRGPTDIIYFRVNFQFPSLKFWWSSWFVFCFRCFSSSSAAADPLDLYDHGGSSVSASDLALSTVLQILHAKGAIFILVLVLVWWMILWYLSLWLKKGGFFDLI